MEPDDLHQLEQLGAAIRARLERYIQRSGLKFNPNSELVDHIITGLAQRQHKLGRAYCPCRMLENDPKIDLKKVCPCAWHRNEILADGMCHCQLFIGPKATQPQGDANG